MVWVNEEGEEDIGLSSAVDDFLLYRPFLAENACHHLLSSESFNNGDGSCQTSQSYFRLHVDLNNSLYIKNQTHGSSMSKSETQRQRRQQRETEREMAGRVVLHGMWASPYSKRVELALKAKGIEYEFVEEDLTNKSEALLRANPVHKKIPVLVHDGKPIAESLVIIEYIDETWKEGPPLLPQDPYERAKVRFWAGFLQQQLFEAIFSVVKTDGEAQARAVKEVHEKLKVLEEGIKGSYPGGSPFINGDNLGLLDIVVCSTLGAQKAHEEVLGLKFLDPEKYPRVTSWVKALTELPLVKEAMPPNEKLVGLLQLLRARALESAAA